MPQCSEFNKKDGLIDCICFAPACKGTTFIWRLTTNRVSRTEIYLHLTIQNRIVASDGVVLLEVNWKIKLILQKVTIQINFGWSDDGQILTHNLCSTVWLWLVLLRMLDAWSVTLGKCRLHNEYFAFTYPVTWPISPASGAKSRLRCQVIICSQN